jgi:hypothetical protein
MSYIIRRITKAPTLRYWQEITGFKWLKNTQSTTVCESPQDFQNCLTKINMRVTIYLPNPENIRSGGPKFLGRIAILRRATLSALARQLTS